MSAAPRTQVLRHESDLGRWEVVSRDADPRLREYVLGYIGVDSRIRFLRERHMPHGEVMVIVNFGPPHRLLDPTNATAPQDFRRAWIVGLQDRYALTESTGVSHLVLVRFTPIGAHLFCGVPMDSLVNRAIELDAVMGPAARGLVERLHEAPGWEARFALLEALVVERVTRARAASEAVAWAWQQLAATNGVIDIGGLAGEIGWSHKHLIARFREQVGVTPKMLGRILRFSRAVRLLDAVPTPSWVEVAVECGYYDQAHFIKDFRSFAGGTPTDFLARRLPDQGGIDGG